MSLAQQNGDVVRIQVEATGPLPRGEVTGSECDLAEADHTWTVTTDHRAGAWAGRRAGETAIHRWDADNAVGTSGSITRAELYLHEWLGAAIPGFLPLLAHTPPPSRMALQLTDATGPLAVTGTSGSVELVHDEHAPAAVTLTGTTSDVLLALSGRPSQAAMTGDHTAFQDWRAILH